MYAQVQPVRANWVAYPGLIENKNCKKIIVSEMRFIDPFKVVKAIEEHSKINWERIKSKSRKREICYPREICYYILYKYTTLSANSIGKMIGGRDHTSVLHGKNRLKDLMDTEPAVRHEVKELIENLY